MKRNTLVRIAPVACVAAVGLTLVALGFGAQASDVAPPLRDNGLPKGLHVDAGAPKRLRQAGLRTLGTQTKHVELHFMRRGTDCYVSGRADKSGVLHDVVMRSYFLYSLRDAHKPSKLVKGVFPEVCLAKSMSRSPKAPHQWVLEDPIYHIFKTDGAQLQESTTNAQQPKVITLLPVKD